MISKDNLLCFKNQDTPSLVEETQHCGDRATKMWVLRERTRGQDPHWPTTALREMRPLSSNPGFPGLLGKD